MSHTPTPWKRQLDKMIQNRNGMFLGSFTLPEDTDHAILCVNAHDKLVAAVRAYLSAQGDCDCDTCCLARAALAAAEGKP